MSAASEKQEFLRALGRTMRDRAEIEADAVAWRGGTVHLSVEDLTLEVLLDLRELALAAEQRADERSSTSSTR